MNFDTLLHNIAQIHRASQLAAGQTLNQQMNLRNWLVGAWLVEYEQDGEDRAVYGAHLIPQLAESLAKQGYRGFSERNLKNFRQVTLAYPGLEASGVAGAVGSTVWIQSTQPKESTEDLLIRQTSAELSSIPEQAPVSASTISAHFPSLHQRALAEAHLTWRDHAWILRLFRSLSFSHLLELSRIDNSLQRAFYELHCLKFYHRELRCLVAVDLKTEPFRHEHAGQMNFYVNYLAENVARPDENPPIGILLCTDKDAAEVHYATGRLEPSVFVSRYLVQLPSEEQLTQWLQEERMMLEVRG